MNALRIVKTSGTSAALACGIPLRRHDWAGRGMPLLCAALVLLPLRAQWLTQSFPLKDGWSGVYLHVDASYADLQQLVGDDPANPIQEIWMWKPAPGTEQFVESPQLPTDENSRWVSWQRSLGPSSELQRLIANAAYLVRVEPTGSGYLWNLLGQPAPPQNKWTVTGLNFLGFATPDPNPPTFDSFFEKAPALRQTMEIYRYVGGELDESNPAPFFAFRINPLPRGEAFWIRAGQSYNRYFGPFELDLQDSRGVEFNDRIGQYRIRLRNLVGAAFASELTVSVELLPSEPPPAGQASIAGTPPLLLRGTMDPTTLRYGFTAFADGPQSRTLAPQGKVGCETDLVIGLNRSQMTDAAGEVFAGVLRFTDSLNLSRVDVPVSAVVGSKAGLWVGEASVTQVRHYLKTYQRDADGAPVQSESGAYQVSSVNSSLGAVPRPFPLRLILHHDADAGEIALLQRVYYGQGSDGQMKLATRESALDANKLKDARRITATHLPYSAANPPWVATGDLQDGSTVTLAVHLPYDDQAANPFLHTYHPDHDNRNATFDQVLPRGSESYGVVRELSLRFEAPPDDFQSLTTSGNRLQGIYDESVTLLGAGSESRQFDVRGAFLLNRISDLPTLTTD